MLSIEERNEEERNVNLLELAVVNRPTKICNLDFSMLSE